MDSLVRKRKEDEDEEIMMFWLPALYLLTSNGGVEKRARHMSSQSGEEMVRYILGGHEKNCLVAFRMEPNIFRAIATYLRTEHLLRDTRGVTVEEKLGLFLFMISHNASYEDLQHEFHLAEHHHCESDARAKKFRNKSFPLFESLGELYDGQTAEGTLNFTSIAPSQIAAAHPSQIAITQPSQDAFTQPYQGDVTQDNYIGGEAERDTFVHNVERIVEQTAARDTAARSRMGKRDASSRKKNTNASDKEEKAGQWRRQDGKVVELMGRFIEMKEKEAEVEAAQHEKTSANEEFSISMCISVVDSMEELSDDEKVEAYDVFKDAQNGAIFMTAKDSTCLRWLRKKITST